MLPFFIFTLCHRALSKLWNWFKRQSKVWCLIQNGDKIDQTRLFPYRSTVCLKVVGPGSRSVPLLCLLLPQIFSQESLHSALPHLHGYCGSGSMAQEKQLLLPMKVSLCIQAEMGTRRNQLLFQLCTSCFHKPRENLPAKTQFEFLGMSVCPDWLK